MKKITLANTQNANKYLKMKLESSFKTVFDMLNDTKNIARVMDSKCIYCYYEGSNGLVGHAMTQYECQNCEKEKMHGNTRYPKYCLSCAKEHQICVECGASIHTNIPTPENLMFAKSV